MRLHLNDRLAVAIPLASGAACAVLAMTVLPGCPLKNCDATFLELNTDPARPSGNALPESRQIDDTTWESGPITGTYIDFPGQRFYNIFPHGFVGQYTSINTYISADSQPSPPDGSVAGNFTLAAGNLAEVSQIFTDPSGSQYGFSLHNDTCAPYYIRVVVTRARPPLAPAPVLDGGVDSGGALDAEADAGSLDGGAE